ncbi:glycosyltransferase family 4 protein [Paenibacillus sp. Marseille-Q4541]|uniref:glycosyltransferase family 4 protein n=1 Tax=Paenibacillus sp. Marseille-Q4541 TaxID=2831522 RepID=UPI001BA6E15C|nr:glycosyltransferase family 4 protein [Paenibacillus sp. Marseille-Q4541]
MHILIVSPEQFPLPGSGSVEICILAIAEQLSHTHQVTVISPLFPHLEEETQWNPQLLIKRVEGKLPSEYSKAVIEVISQLKQSIDIIQVDNRPRYMSKIKRAFPSIPVVLFLHSLTFVPQNSHIAACLQKADFIVTNSKSLEQVVLKRFPLGAEKVIHITLGVDYSRFRPLEAAEKRTYYDHFQIREDQFHILYVGRLIPQKGIPVLIRAIHLLRPEIKAKAHLLIAGKAKNRTYTTALKKLARKLHVSVTFLGEIPHEKIHTLYPLAHCMVCPSQKHEAFGLVNIEAMSCGIPVITSKNGGMKEIVNDGHNGFLVSNYKNARGFASPLSKLLVSPELSQMMGNNGRKTVQERYTWQVTAQKLEEAYSRLLFE